MTMTDRYIVVHDPIRGHLVVDLETGSEKAYCTPALAHHHCGLNNELWNRRNGGPEEVTNIPAIRNRYAMSGSPHTRAATRGIVFTLVCVVTLVVAYLIAQLFM